MDQTRNREHKRRALARNHTQREKGERDVTRKRKERERAVSRIQAAAFKTHTFPSKPSDNKKLAEYLTTRLKEDYEQYGAGQDYLQWFADRFALIWKSWLTEEPMTLTCQEEMFKNDIINMFNIHCEDNYKLCIKKCAEKWFAPNWMKVIKENLISERPDVEQTLDEIYLNIMRAAEPNEQYEDRSATKNVHEKHKKKPHHEGIPDRIRQHP